MVLWKILNKIDLTRRLDNFVIKYFSFDKESKKIDFTFEEAWRIFRYSLNSPTWEQYVKNVKIVASVFAITGIPYMVITVLIKLFL